ncbi:MAG TPA: RidA family protein [Aggregatilineales bacterium]|nr:RidA family protein [Anaerolineales bacterium]HRE47726.1 RidA family protein [Aggregatilineales bacterium]
MAHNLISSGTTWEREVGYSRAVRVGNHIWVAGTVAADEDSQPVGVGDAYAQAAYIFKKIERALVEAGGALTDIVRTRLYILREEDAAGVMRAHGEVFGEIRPASTLIRIAGLVNPTYLVEIEVDAFLEG